MSETSGGLMKNRWWGPRIVLKTGFLFFRFLDRIAPWFTDLMGVGIETAHKCQQRIRIARPDVVTMRVGETRFRLCLVGGHKMAHHDYVPLAREGRVYEPLATACLTRFLRRLPAPTFMDIGAFVGYFTCYAAALLEDQRPVWAVESNPVFCETIRKAVVLNGFTCVRVLQAALSDRSRTTTIEDMSLLPSLLEGPGRRVVQTVTLDDLCAREAIAPTIVKIDVHGAEGMVLRGMSRLLQETIQIVLLELHALYLYEPHSPDITRVELLDWLQQSGFSVFYVSGHREGELSGVSRHVEQGRFAYVPMTAATRQHLLFDRTADVLIVASKISDLSELLGPSVDLATAVG